MVEEETYLKNLPQAGKMFQELLKDISFYRSQLT